MKLKNDIVNLIVRVEHHLCPQYCGTADALSPFYF